MLALRLQTRPVLAMKGNSPAWSAGLQAVWIWVVRDEMKAWALQRHLKSVRVQPVAPIPASAGACCSDSQ